MSDFDSTSGAKTKALEKWADVAMYKSQAVPEDGPRVYLLDMTPDPLGLLAKACRLFEGIMPPEAGGDPITDEERRRYFTEMTKTKLSSPLEYIGFTFFFDGVARWWTHQVVRQRIGASYVQESLRFATLQPDEDPGGWSGRTELPPSLLNASDDTPQRVVWDGAIKAMGEAYQQLVAAGMPAEEARGLLPIATKTRIHDHINLRALYDMAGSRLCTQAQFQWRAIVAQMIQQIRNWPLPDDQKWQLDLIVSPLRPQCWQIGRCAFRAMMDRHCSIRDSVEDYYKHGIPSSQWEEGATVTGDDGLPRKILPIMPYEWLANPAAARLRPGAPPSHSGT